MSSVPGTERALTALTRALTYAGCLEGKVEERSDQIVLDAMRIIRPHHGGMLALRALALPARVVAGQRYRRGPYRQPPDS